MMNRGEEAEDGEGNPNRAWELHARAMTTKLKKDNCFRTLKTEGGQVVLTDTYGRDQLEYVLGASVRPSSIGKLAGNEDYVYVVDLHDVPPDSTGKPMVEILGGEDALDKFMRGILPATNAPAEEKTTSERHP